LPRGSPPLWQSQSLSPLTHRVAARHTYEQEHIITGPVCGRFIRLRSIFATRETECADEQQRELDGYFELQTPIYDKD
jgi:hypothetical protein